MKNSRYQIKTLSSGSALINNIFKNKKKERQLKKQYGS